MEKIVDNVAESVEKDSGSFKDEFLKAQKKMFEKFPTPESFSNLIDSLKDLTEEQKEKLKQNLADRAANADKFKEMLGKKRSMETTYQDYFVFVVMILLISAVIGENRNRYLFKCTTGHVYLKKLLPCDNDGDTFVWGDSFVSTEFP